jgi:hypothetical protein
MPPLYTYTFENVNNDNTAIIIKAYNYAQAVNKLEEIAKNPKDFQTKP